MSTSGPVILIKDSDSARCSLMKEIFSQGYTVLEAENEADIFSILLRNGHVSLILLALDTPAVSSEKILKEINQNPLMNSISVVIEDNSELGEKLACMAGSAGFVNLNCSPEEIKQKIDEFLDRKDNASRSKGNEAWLENSRMDAMMNLFPVGVASYRISDGQVVTTTFNDAICQMGGYSRKELADLVEKDAFSVVVPEDVPGLKAEIERSLRFNQDIHNTYRVFTQDRRIKWIQATGHVYARNKDSVDYMATFLDYTNQKENEINQQWKAEHDELVNAYSRMAFYRKTAELLMKNSDKKYVIVATDIENFKVINELCGSAQGDRILQITADAFQDEVRNDGISGRLYSDHFVHCFPKEKLDLKKALRKFSNIYAKMGLDIFIHVNMGIYEIDDPHLPIDQMCDRAFMACRSIRGNYLRYYAFYTDEMRLKLIDEQHIASVMDEALENGQFVIYLQPIYETFTRKICAAEALVRWKHPTLGIRSPNDFVPLFERNGFITKLDRYIWEEACKVQRSLLDSNRSIVPISVNLSRLDFYTHDLCDFLIGLINKYQLKPTMINLEITETVYTEGAEVLLPKLDILRKFGFKIMMDDFGSGYSSLGMLMDVRADFLKIDMHFVQELGKTERAASLINSIVHMTKWLDMSTVAEGVETEAQFDFLRSIGCNEIQGYYFSKPLDKEEFVKVLAVGIATIPEKRLNRAINMLDMDSLWKSDSESSILFNMMGGVGLYELNGKNLEFIRGNDAYYQMTGHDREKPNVHPIERVAEEDRDRLLSTCENALNSGNVETVVIQRLHEDGHIMWLEIHIKYLGYSGEGQIFVFSFINITNQQVEEEKESRRRIFETVKAAFDELYVYHFPQGTYEKIISPSNRDGLAQQGSLTEVVNVLRDRTVNPKDVQKYIETLDLDRIHRETAAAQNGCWRTQYYLYTPNHDNPYWSERVIKCLDNHNGETYLCGINYISERKTAEAALSEINILREQERTNQRYRFVLNQTGTVVLEWNLETGAFKADEGFSEYACSRQDFPLPMEIGAFYRFVHPLDRKALKTFFIEKEQEKSFTETLLRLEKIDGSWHWCHLTNFYLMDKEGRKTDVVMSIQDVNKQETEHIELIETEQKLRDNMKVISRQSELYHMMLDQSQTILFDFDPDSDTMKYSILKSDETREERTVKNFLEDFSQDKIFPEDYSSLIREKIRAALSREQTSYFDFQADFFKSGPRWYRAYFRSITDQNGKIFRLIGRADDINDEKITTEKLIDSTKRDPLTKLYNRITSEELINQYMAELPENGIAALMVIDIDDFKRVNDQMGHLMGDALLKAISSNIKELFYDRDVVGRIGGDEFVVFMHRFEGLSIVYRKAQKIQEIFHNIKISELGAVKCSIGITITNSSKDDYHSLISQADQALYTAKFGGKDCYVVYDPEDPEQQHTVEQRKSGKMEAVGAKIDSDIVHPENYIDLVEDMITSLYNGKNPEQSIPSILKTVGEGVNVNRAYICILNPENNNINHYYEWDTNEILSIKAKLGDSIPEKLFSKSILSLLNDDGIFYCQNSSDLPEDLKETAESLNTKSLLQIFMKKDGKIIGTVGFDDCFKSRFWTKDQINLLVLIARILSMFLGIK